jgi:hypothetical protein
MIVLTGKLGFPQIEQGAQMHTVIDLLQIAFMILSIYEKARNLRRSALIGEGGGRL